MLAAGPAAADDPEPARPAIWRADRFSVSWGLGGWMGVPFPQLAEVVLRGTWSPLPWVGLTGDLAAIDYFLVVPFAESVRIGPTLRPWSLDTAVVSPYLTTGVGLLHGSLPDVDPFTVAVVRGEAGVDVRLGKPMFMSVGAGALQAVDERGRRATLPFALFLLGGRS
jgi:hypothetical protein